MKSVVIAGATGYLGRYLVKTYLQRGWHVRALVRNADKALAVGLEAHELIKAQATRRETLQGRLKDADLVVSCLGITRQRDGLRYRDVDYQANANLLDEAVSAGVSRFAYVHVLHADRMRHLPLVEAKQAFVDRLRSTSIDSTVIAPSGFFSDMAELFAMAGSGRVWLFGKGTPRVNPIHGADLALAIAQAVDAGRDWLNVGGPDIYTQTELAGLAFEALKRPAKTVFLPDGLRRAALRVLPYVTPRRIHGPARFFLTALGMDMVGECHGRHHLSDYFAALATGRQSPD